MRQIDSHNFRAAKTFREPLRGRPGCAAKVDDDARIDDKRLQSSEQAIPRYAVDKIRIVEAACRGVKSTADIGKVKRMAGIHGVQLVAVLR